MKPVIIIAVSDDGKVGVNATPDLIYNLKLLNVAVQIILSQVPSQEISHIVVPSPNDIIEGRS